MKQWRKVLLIACLLIAGAAICYITYVLGVERKNHEIYEQLKNSAQTTAPTEATVPPTSVPPVTVSPTNPTEAQTEETTEATTEATEETKEPFQSPLDFVSLQRTNEDIYAWIDILGTSVSYPVLQHAFENDFYLMHTADGTYGWPGAIYSRTYAAKDFSDFVTVLYGHNMLSGTMFAQLLNYRDESFLQEHRVIMVYTPYATYEFTVFAAVLYNNRLIDDLYDYDTEEGRLAFLDSLGDTRNLNNHILDDIPVGVDDKILVLSTCPGGGHEYRYLVLAVMSNVEE